jgi:hypothetical protein
MEPAREAPWAEHEKVKAAPTSARPTPNSPVNLVCTQVYLLAEIVKSSLPSHVLLGIIREYNIQPQWNDIALPHGMCPAPPTPSISHEHMALSSMPSYFTMGEGSISKHFGPCNVSCLAERSIANTLCSSP